MMASLYRGGIVYRRWLKPVNYVKVNAAYQIAISDAKSISFKAILHSFQTKVKNIEDSDGRRQ